MTTPIQEGALLWTLTEEIKQQSILMRYIRWLNREKGISFHDRYDVW